MDYTILYAILILIGTVLVIYGTLYLKKRVMVSQEDLQFVSNTLNLSLAIIDELDLSKEKEIKNIGAIVFGGLNMAIGLYGTEDRDKVILMGKDLCFKLAEDQGIQLTENRKVIIVNLLELALNQKLLDTVK
jgi:hypothetical protein